MFALRPLKEFLFPFNIVLLLMGVVIYLVYKQRNRRMALTLMAISLGILVLGGCPLLSGVWIGLLEKAYPTYPLARYPQASAIVVLGGSLTRLIPPRVELEENRGSRLLPAARLFQLKKAPKIIVSGGNPYAVNGVARTEASDMKEFLLQLGVPESAILMEAQSRNTLEEAVEVAKLARELRLDNVLLVTSAFHQPRAVALFEKQGLKVVPVPVAHLMKAASFTLVDYIPSVAALQNTTVAINEFYGILWYWLRGKI